MRQFWRLERRTPCRWTDRAERQCNTYGRTVPLNILTVGRSRDNMKNLFVRFVREEEGQDIIEYALLAAFISIVAWLILREIGQDVQTMYSSTSRRPTGRRVLV